MLVWISSLSRGDSKVTGTQHHYDPIPMNWNTVRFAETPSQPTRSYSAIKVSVPCKQTRIQYTVRGQSRACPAFSGSEGFPFGIGSPLLAPHWGQGCCSELVLVQEKLPCLPCPNSFPPLCKHMSSGLFFTLLLIWWLSQSSLILLGWKKVCMFFFP